MTDDQDTEELRTAEHRLQAAQLAADADALAELLDDRVIFTGPDGKHYTKQDEDEIQRSGKQAFTNVDELELTVLVAGDTGVTWFHGRLAGTVNGEQVDARLRYTRTWIRTGSGWRVIAAHASFV